DRHSIAYLDYTTSALPYHLATPRSVLILGAGGGSDVLQARYHSVERIEAVELNPQITGLVDKQYAEFAGHLYDDPSIRVHTAEARGFLLDSPARFDLIQSTLVGSFSAQPAGLTALNENYLFTVEALRDAIGRLTPDGYLSLTVWVALPPRNALKLFATAIDALSRGGGPDVSRRLAMIRGWQTSTLLVKNGPFTDEDIEAIRRFAATRSFDVVYYPGMQRAEANRYNLLDRPYFHEGAVRLLGSGRDQFVDRYKFSLTPATDDKPYFSHFFRWNTLPEILSLRGRGGESLLEVGYLTLVVTLLQALVVGIVLILVPLAFLKRDRLITAPRQVLLYFLSLGLGFIILEVAILQKSMLVLHHPIYAAAVVIGTLLVCAGLGSQFADRYAATAKARGVLYIAVAIIIGLGLVHAFAVGSLFKLVIGMPFIFKVLLLIVLVAPLGFVLGMPFPLGLARLAAGSPRLVAWAWGINGCASVVSAMLATLLGMHFGFNVAMIVALVCYGVALMSFPTQRSTG
ncbi:MAG: SAM-dependent methyltransferase, partial [Gammaproteobacteria bacterium]|nr:SAM-dependent methyltransferase [Gammaproteobacteria bacterium]